MAELDGHRPALLGGYGQLERLSALSDGICRREVHAHDFEDALEADEVGRVSRVQGKLGGDRRRGDEDVECSAASCFAAGADESCVHASIGACGRCVKLDRVEGGLGSLKSVLATRALGWVVGCMWAGGELRKCDRRDCDLRRESLFGDLLDLDDDGGVDDAARMLSVRHVA